MLVAHGLTFYLHPTAVVKVSKPCTVIGKTPPKCLLRNNEQRDADHGDRYCRVHPEGVCWETTAYPFSIHLRCDWCADCYTARISDFHQSEARIGVCCRYRNLIRSAARSRIYRGCSTKLKRAAVYFECYPPSPKVQRRLRTYIGMFGQRTHIVPCLPRDPSRRRLESNLEGVGRQATTQ